MDSSFPSYTHRCVRIMYISSAVTYGGGERHVVDLAREMSTRGHDVFVGLRPTNQWQARLDFVPTERLHPRLDTQLVWYVQR